MFGDEIISSQTSARDFCSAIFINNLHWRWSRESAKTLYGSYENFNGDVPIINVDDILCETIKHVNKEHIGASYRAAYRKFVPESLKEVQIKDLYSHEINFKGRVGDTDHIYRSSQHLLMEETNVGEKISQMLFSWKCSFPQLFQTSLSKKLF